MFDKVLVANRGEIARRVIRTCRQHGIATVAVHSEADRGAAHVVEADEAVLLGPAPASASYLRVDRIVAAARATGAQAVHPGYGFLSENPDLARACADAGVVFVGPSPDVIRLMGDKAAAKAAMAEAGVPVVPGVDATAMDDDEIVAVAGDVGFPLLIKAAAGGGGKGMRAVHAPDRLADALAAARREAANAFGDDRVILERLVAEPRHVEIQVFGDSLGNVVHLFERECSIQRRHQKIVEETPSPAVDARLRQRMGDAAVRAARTVGYVGAGTVEFVLDAGSAGPEPEFFFLEMNTRLQVEHPVTELVTGTDLVAWQLQVAAGQPLPARQDELTQSGHAIEVRLYAEDVPAGFLPQTGTVLVFDPPRADDVRVDSGIEAGDQVSRFYDPMLAKLIVHADTRDGALDRMTWLLAHTPVLGVTTNIEHLAAVVAHEAFRAGDTTTHFLDRHLSGWAPAPLAHDVVVAATVALQVGNETAPPRSGDPHSPWQRLGPWRTGQVGGWHVRLDEADRDHSLAVTGRAGRFRVSDGDHVHDVEARRSGSGVDVEVDGHDVPLVVATSGRDLWVHVPGRSRCLHHRLPTRHVAPGAVSGATAFTSPMPGAVIAVAVAAGDTVVAGTTMMVVEAMKMEHPVVAPADGTVSAVHVRVGDGVDGGQPLLDFRADEAEDDGAEDDGAEDDG